LNKKLLLIPLALLLIISMVVIGCPGETTTTPPPPPPPTKTTTPPPTTPPPPEPVTLSFGGLWPPFHPFSVATMEWIDKVAAETDGLLTIEPFWGGALYGSRDSATELAKGVADCGDYSGAYAPAGFGFEKAMRLSFQGVYEKEVIMQVWDEVLAKFPELETEHTDAGIKVLAWGPIPPYQVVNVGKPIRTVDDFQGQVFKTTGDWAKMVAYLGGEGQTIGMGDTYTALQKNTIDGAFVTYETCKTFKFAEVVDYITVLDIASAPAGHWGMCLDVYNDLPPEFQKVIDDNVDWFGLRVADLTYAADIEGIAELEANGVEFINLSPLDLAFVYAAADTTIREEMAELDAQGLPGTAVYNEICALIKKYS